MSDEGNLYFGEDCPKGKVQVESVSCYPRVPERFNDGWRPTDFTAIELYVDGQRFRIEAGNIDTVFGKRRGVHIYAPAESEVKLTANTVSICIDEGEIKF